MMNYRGYTFRSEFIKFKKRYWGRIYKCEWWAIYIYSKMKKSEIKKEKAKQKNNSDEEIVKEELQVKEEEGELKLE